MKKSVSLIMSIMILLLSTASCFAEAPTITLPLNLQFNMPLELAIIASGCEKKTVPADNDLYYYLARIGGLGFDRNYFKIPHVTIGGYDAEMYVYFQDGKLKQIEYHISVSDSSLDACKSSYLEVDPALASIYGDYSATINVPHSLSNKISYSWGKWTASESVSGNQKSTYIIPCGDGCVVIENFVTHIGMSSSEGRYTETYKHIISYTVCDYLITPSAPATQNTDFGF